MTEVTDPRKVDIVADARRHDPGRRRNMQNFVLLTEVGRAGRPVLLKRGMSATVKDLLMSAEYILSQGNPNVVLCERGVQGLRDRDAKHVRRGGRAAGQEPLALADHRRSQPRHRPAELIGPCALAGVAAGADGVHIEVHNCPEEAMSDGEQALLPEQYAEVVDQIRRVAEVIGKIKFMLAARPRRCRA